MERPPQASVPSHALSAREARILVLLIAAAPLADWAWRAWTGEEGRWTALFLAVLTLAMLLAGIGRWRGAENPARARHRYLRLSMAVWLVVGAGLAAAVYTVGGAAIPLMFWFGFTAVLAYLDAKPRITEPSMRRRPKAQAENAARPAGPAQRVGPGQRVHPWWRDRARPGFYAALAFGGWLAAVLPALVVRQGPGWWLLILVPAAGACLYAVVRTPPQDDLRGRRPGSQANG